MNIIEHSFWCRASAANKKGYCPLMITITRGNEQVKFSTGVLVSAENWIVEEKMFSRKDPNHVKLNTYIENTQKMLNSIAVKFYEKGYPFTLEMIKQELMSGGEKVITILKSIEIHNKDFETKLGRIGFSKATYAKYTQLYNVMRKFIKDKYKINDYPVLNINHEFVSKFYNFTMMEANEDGKELTRNSCLTYLSKLRKIVGLHLKSGEISINPFALFDMKEDIVTKFPLSKNQIELIMNYSPTSKALDRVKDRAIVGIYTGLSYSEISSCTTSSLITTFNQDFKYWLQKERGKTHEPTSIPLLDPVLKIIEKYRNDENVGLKGYLFPQISNKNNNKNLKKLKIECGLGDINLSTHIFRHTFGSLMLNQGVNLEAVANMMGHADSKTTRKIYAKINHHFIGSELAKVKNELFKKEKLNDSMYG